MKRYKTTSPLSYEAFKLEMYFLFYKKELNPEGFGSFLVFFISRLLYWKIAASSYYKKHQCI